MNADQQNAHAAADALDPMRGTEIFVSRLLQVGVAASFLLIVLGTIVTFAHHPDYLKSSEALARLGDARYAHPHSLRELADGIADFRGQAITTAGLLLLIATPIARVLALVVAYYRHGDRLFALLATVVLALLLVSFFLGHVE